MKIISFVIFYWAQNGKRTDADELCLCIELVLDWVVSPWLVKRNARKRNL